jgi:N-acylneuraminate cytidylyltransferase
VITARGGSKGVPGKNTRSVHGLPLIGWTISAALKSNYLDRVILSSDSSEIISLARHYGCDTPFVRPSELATDLARSSDVLAHAIEELEENYDLIVLLQPTSPLRTAEDIDAAIEIITSSSAPSVISVCEVDKSPYWMYKLNGKGCLVPFTSGNDIPSRRQDCEPVYVPNGAIYVVRTELFLTDRLFVYSDTRALVMPALRSVDIDTYDDLELLECLCQKHPELIPALG